MPKLMGNVFLRRLQAKGIIPDNAISVDIRCRWDELPTMTVETVEDERWDAIIDCIDSAERITPPPPRPKVDKPPATEMRGI